MKNCLLFPFFRINHFQIQNEKVNRINAENVRKNWKEKMKQIQKIENRRGVEKMKKEKKLKNVQKIENSRKVEKKIEKVGEKLKKLRKRRKFD